MPKLFKLFCVLFFFNSLVHTEVGLAQQLGAPYVGETQIQNGPAEPSPPGEYTSPLPLAEALNCAHSVDRLLSESRLYVLPDSRRDDQNFRGNSDRFQPITFIPMSQEGERGVMVLEYDQIRFLPLTTMRQDDTNLVRNRDRRFLFSVDSSSNRDLMPIVGNLYSLLATPVEQWELSGLGLVGDEDHISYMTEEKYLSEPEPAVVGPVLTRLFEITNSSLEVAWRRTQSTPITSEQDRETALSQYSEVICNCMGVEEIIEITGEILSSELFADNLQSLSCMSLMM